MGCKMDKRIDHTQTKAGRTAGFTLIEVMVAVVVMSILAAVAFPSYLQHVARTKRSAAQTFMYGVASKQEQFLLDARKYAISLAELNLATPGELIGFYTFTVDTNNAATPPTYLITATAVAPQSTRDQKCGNLTLSQSGEKKALGSSPANCW